MRGLLLWLVVASLLDDCQSAPVGRGAVGLQVLPEQILLTEIGEEDQFIAVVTFGDGSSRTEPGVSWAGDAPRVFRIEDAEIGIVRAVGEGEGTVTATLLREGEPPITATGRVIVRVD